MRARLLSAAVGLPLVLAAAWAGGPWLAGLVALVACVAIIEWLRLARLAGHLPLTAIGLLLTLALVVNGLFAARFTLPIVAAGLFAALVWQLARRDLRGAVGDLGVTMAGALYCGGLLSYALLLREVEEGRGWLLFALLTTFATDTAAFFVGRALGRHRWWPSVSPGKTWEGVAGGLVGVAGAAALLQLWLDLPAPWIVVLALGLAVGAVSQVGDLAESLLKRSAGVKDAGSLIPGHGGVLDRLDSIVFSLAVVYYGVAWGLR